jgi:hypothetical protein
MGEVLLRFGWEVILAPELFWRLWRRVNILIYIFHFGTRLR